MHGDNQNCSLKNPKRVLFTQHTALQKYFSTIVTLSKSRPYLLADNSRQMWSQASAKKLISEDLKQSIVIYPNYAEESNFHNLMTLKEEKDTYFSQKQIYVFNNF